MSKELRVIRVLFIWLLLLVILTSCGSLQREDRSQAQASPTMVRGVLATVAPRIEHTPLPVTATIVTANMVLPTIVPTATEQPPQITAVIQATAVPPSRFSGLRFSLTPGGTAQNEFPAGTVKIYALWEYKGMSPEDNIHRIWFRDDQIWLTRKEAWDWDEYGSAGTVRDISIFDNEGAGLPPASYRLQLYVNDELQEEASFIVHGS